MSPEKKTAMKKTARKPQKAADEIWTLRLYVAGQTTKSHDRFLESQNDMRRAPSR